MSLPDRWNRCAAIKAIAVVVATVGLTIGIATPRTVVATTPETEPVLVLTSTNFSVPSDGVFAATLELRGVTLPNAAFEGSPPNTSNEPTFPTSFLVTAWVYDPLPSVAALDEFSAEDARAIDVESMPFDTVATPTDDGARIELSFDGSGSTGELTATEPGLYPIRLAVVRDGTSLATLDTFFEIVGDSSNQRAPVTAAVVARLPDIGPAPDQPTLESTLAQTRRLIRLANATDRPISAAVAPSVTAFLRSQHPDVLSELVSALEGETVIALPTTTLDADTAIANDVGNTFIRTVERGRSSAADTFPDATIDDSVTILDTGASSEGLGRWVDTGVSTAIVGRDAYSSAVGADPGRDAPTLATAEASGARVLPIAVANGGTDTLARPLTDTETPTSRAVEFLAFVAAARLQGDPGLDTLLLTTPTIGVPNPDIVAAVDAASDDPTFKWGSIGDLGDVAAEQLADTNAIPLAWQPTGVPDLGPRLERLRPARLIVGDALSMLGPDDERQARWPSTLDDSLTKLADDDQAIRMIEGITAEAEGLKAMVSPPDAFKFTLTGPESTLRFQLINNADTELTVVVSVTSDRLSAPSETTVDLAPNAVSEVAVDVITRSNGTANLRISLRTPAGNPIGQPVSMTGRVNTYSGLGQLFSVGALLVLTTWWVTHLRRRRRPSQPVAEDEPDNATDDDPGGDEPDDNRSSTTANDA